MKNKLKQITDLTIQEVLGNEIILPSTYFKTFDKNIKKIDKNLKVHSIISDPLIGKARNKNMGHFFQNCRIQINQNDQLFIFDKYDNVIRTAIQ